MRNILIVLLATFSPLQAFAAIDAYIKIQSEGGSRIDQLEFDLHYGKDYIALHGAATLINPPDYGPVTGSCAFQDELTLFCSTDFGVSGTLSLNIYFDEEEIEGEGEEIRDITWDIYTPTGGFVGGTGRGDVVAFEEYTDFQPDDIYARWQMVNGTGINTDLTAIEMDIEVGHHFLAVHGKATRQSGAVPLVGTCIREQDGDYYCVTDYAGYGDATMLLRPSGSTAIMAMRSYGNTGAETGRATGSLVELK